MPKSRVPTSVFSEEYELFLRHFRDARESAGLSQEQVAKRLEKAQSYVSKSQIGERRIDVIELYNYCCALGISFADFARNLEQSLQELEQHKAERVKKRVEEKDRLIADKKERIAVIESTL